MWITVKSVSALGFFRAGLQFDPAGRTLSTADLSDSARRAIEDEPHLHVRPATKAEITAQAARADTPGQADLINDLIGVIPALPDGAFGRDGPKLGALRAALPDADPKLITKEAAQSAFEVLVEGGFTPPSTGD